MILKIFAVRDRQGESFAAPMFIPMPGQALRSFSDEINRQAADNPLYAHPDDFDLYQLGEFNTDTGRFDCPSDPVLLSLGKNLKLNGSST